MRLSVPLPLSPRRRGAALLCLAALAGTALPLRAQTAEPSSPSPATSSSAPARARPTHYWRWVAAGFVSSILAHEAGHVGTSLAMGYHPYFGFDRMRPTIYSGIDSDKYPHDMFRFSSAGLTTQSVIDEAVLDVPHPGRGAPFERGVLAGGIATALFYITIGRNDRVSDVTFMSETSSLSKTQISAIFGGIALLHAARIAHDGHYANFFARPRERGGVAVGVRVE